MALNRLLFVCLFFTLSAPSFGQVATCDSIMWNPSRPLTWADFRGDADTSSKIGALSFISIRYTLENKRDGHYLTVLNYIEPCKSWFKTADSTLSLQHEQVHFDIDEYIRRSFISEVFKLKNFSRYASPGVRDLYLNAMNNRNFLHYRFDIESDYHRNAEQEEVWRLKIIGMIKDLDRFNETTYIFR